MKPRQYSQRLHVTTINRHGEIRGHYLTNSETVGTTLRRLREIKYTPLSQRDLATMLNTTQSRISQIEDFTYKGTTLTTLQKVADALGWDVAIVFTERDEATAG